MEDLKALATLVHELNRVTNGISTIVGRPAQMSHVGDFVASRIFGIGLEHSSSATGIDGRFRHGKLAGKTVNIEWCSKNDGLLDMEKEALPDFYLVMTGTRAEAESTEGTVGPWVIDYVYLIGTEPLVRELKKRGRDPGEATSVRREDWDRCEVYPRSACPYLTLTDVQRAMLRLFRAGSIGI